MRQPPQFFRVRQLFHAPRLDDIPGEVQAQLTKLDLGRRIKPGQSVAVTAGSRGIANIHVITRAVVRHLLGLGAKPFIVPSMGSHAGGTAEGQRALIEAYGVTEEYCGCPIRSSMETVVVCDTAEGFPVHFDKHAYGADHVVVVGRVKPHTNFVGDIESGLMKMMLIGLGKHEGAKIYHRAIMDYSFGQIVRSVGREVLERCRIAAGVGIVENGYDETALIEAVAPAEFEEREKLLLRQAKQLMPKLPFERVDILIIDEIGKNISGSGMDTNVVGRKYNDHAATETETPKIKRIFVRGLTHETHGNATGIGMSEFCLTRVVEAMDRKITTINCLTGGHATAAMVPIHFDTDAEVLDAALDNIGLTTPAQAKMLWAQNTLQVGTIECSAAYLNEARERKDLEIASDLRPLPMGTGGMLPDFAGWVGNGKH
jgi:hypothetical protein